MRVNPKNSHQNGKLYFYLFCIYMRFWMLPKPIAVNIS